MFKKPVTMFALLLVAFSLLWGYKMRHPINRPEAEEGELTTAWYEEGYTASLGTGDEWYMDPEIPSNYIPMPGQSDVYMVVDDSGNVLSYRKRKQLEDGSWQWDDVEMDSGTEMEPVDGVDDLFKVTDENGNESYKLYVRNEDDNTYCYVEADQNGDPYYDGADAEVIADNFKRVDGNIYAVYNEDGIREGYAERVKNAEGSFIWQNTDAPVLATISGLQTYSSLQEAAQQNAGIQNTGSTRQNNNDGSYTVKESYTETKTEDGYSVIYQTTVYSTYSQDGTLLQTKKEGPTEISRTAMSGSTGSADQSLIQSTLDGELARVSAKVTFDTAKAQEVLADLNAERSSQGLSQLSMDTGSDVYKLACIRAADMAIYNATSSTSQMYGTLGDMVARWGISCNGEPTENIWAAPVRSASEIHSRFQSVDTMRQIRMSSIYSSVGIAIVDTDGRSYIAEIYLP